MNPAVVLDIEGTTSPAGYIRDRLFGYARDRVEEWVRRPDPEVLAILDRARDLAGQPDAAPTEVGKLLIGWIDADRKAAPLKELQGLMWQDGFAAGELTATVYGDVPGALRSWHAAGVEVFSFSSGSVLAQRLWYQYTEEGDLRHFFAGYFDPPAAGPKGDAGSYRRIARTVGRSGEEITFLSDSQSELDAAREAGWHTIGVRRADDSAADGIRGHRVVADFATVTGP